MIEKYLSSPRRRGGAHPTTPGRGLFCGLLWIFIIHIIFPIIYGPLFYGAKMMGIIVRGQHSTIAAASMGNYPFSSSSSERFSFPTASSLPYTPNSFDSSFSFLEEQQGLLSPLPPQCDALRCRAGVAKQTRRVGQCVEAFNCSKCYTFGSADITRPLCSLVPKTPSNTELLWIGSLKRAEEPTNTSSSSTGSANSDAFQENSDLELSAKIDEEYTDEDNPPKKKKKKKIGFQLFAGEEKKKKKWHTKRRLTMQTTKKNH